jgi:hypothetical protein
MTVNRSEKEEEYFARMEFEAKRKIEEENQRRAAEVRKQKEKEAHWMKCPKCGVDLAEIDYNRIKVDKCGDCGGVWFDAGELEMAAKIDKHGLDKLISIFTR